MIGKYSAWLMALFFMACGAVHAQTTDPEVLMKTVTEEVLQILREDKSIQSGNRQKAVKLIEDKIAPHFDFVRMTGLAVGRGWRQGNATQQKALTEEFRTLLIRTYANALTGYTNETVTFKPTRQTGGEEVTVRSQINKPGARPIPIHYSLARSADGWKVFDVAIADVSLVTNYRSTFAVEVDKGGLDGLLKSLQEKNRRFETAPPPGA